MSLAAGPLLAPTAVTAVLAVRGAIIAVATMFLADLILRWRSRHDRWPGALLLLLYGVVYVAMTR